MIRIRKSKTTRKKLTGPSAGKSVAEKASQVAPESRDQFKGQSRDLLKTISGETRVKREGSPTRKKLPGEGRKHLSLEPPVNPRPLKRSLKKEILFSLESSLEPQKSLNPVKEQRYLSVIFTPQLPEMLLLTGKREQFRSGPVHLLRISLKWGMLFMER